MHRTRVILTVDTEPDIAGSMQDRRRHPPLLDEPIWGEINGRSEALGFITRTLAQYDLKATFFVETLHTRYFGQGPMKRYTDHLLEAEQDIQLHIHPVWQNFSFPESAGQRHFDDSSTLEEEAIYKLIEEGCMQIQAWTGRRPEAMRTGNFAASRTVYRAMARANLKLASNICIANAHYADASLRQAGGSQMLEGVWEYPASCFTDPGPTGRGGYRAAQITACSTRELIAILQQCAAQSVETLVLVTHPFEFIKRSDFRYSSLRPNAIVQRRLEHLCRYLSQHKDRYEVSTFGELTTQPRFRAELVPSLKTSVIASLTRSAQNYINDRI